MLSCSSLIELNRLLSATILEEEFDVDWFGKIMLFVVLLLVLHVHNELEKLKFVFEVGTMLLETG